MKPRPTILVVDDEQPIRDLLAEALADDGYVVARAGDGVSALQIAVVLQPDLIISDIMMPRLDGLAFIALARSRGVAAPAILMSAIFTPCEYLDSIFVQKPFDLDEMLLTVDQLLSAHATVEPVAAHQATSPSLRERLTPARPWFTGAGAMARAR